MKKTYIKPSVTMVALKTQHMLAQSGIKTNTYQVFGEDADDGDSGDARESLWGEEEW